MLQGGFNLRSWASNNRRLQATATEEGVLDNNKVTKVLGMLWYTETDEISYPDRDIPIFDNVTKRAILHIQAYGAVAYLCRKHESKLIFAKSRVAPLKKLSLPKLELMAAVIGARIANHLQQAMEVQENYILLRLYLDQDGYVRCGGRIHNAPIDENTKFPILLPAKHPLTRLIILDAHEKQLHSGISATKCHIRQTFWIPVIRQCVKSQLRKCTTCRKVNSKPYIVPDPPPLPAFRVESSPPFTVTGLDFSGALYVREETGRESKAYVCLFTCASTRAVHIELVHDLSEDTFMQAFRRFVSRRSLPRLIISDNATTFQAASNTLKSLLESQTLKEQLGFKGTEWRFIPKRAPWFGGWWERMIGLVKTALKKVLGRSFVTFVVLQTILTEIEAILNDRPLTYVTSDTLDPEPLTPSHLLHGRRLTELHDNIDTQKSGHNEQTIRVGDVVQVHEECPRIRWKLAVVDELMPGRDGLIRAAKIRTGSDHTTRPIAKLYPLEINEKE
ncbi:uncharacterized protein LOC132744251 [Ruditapes philippinarum]|uniref:uncharacterized protein LOC132744251 n=1 Tax=Ruditapes philippinarum TaxID=129788 RepID=UPI00295AF8AD|nr:uncharacterized protein LOC132744251 [Ruditapes philippinarum]